MQASRALRGLAPAGAPNGMGMDMMEDDEEDDDDEDDDDEDGKDDDEGVPPHACIRSDGLPLDLHATSVSHAEEEGPLAVMPCSCIRGAL